jgi:hypothetical protein
MIDLPAIDECLIAVDGETRRNGNVVGTSGCIQLSEARLSTTDPNLFVGTEYEAFERVRAACRLTRLGLDAMAYARVATGDIDLVIESGLKPHDYDALVAVVRGAGGHVGNWGGGTDLSAGSVAAASREPTIRRGAAFRPSSIGWAQRDECDASLDRGWYPSSWRNYPARQSAAYADLALSHRSKPAANAARSRCADAAGFVMRWRGWPRARPPVAGRRLRRADDPVAEQVAGSCGLFDTM